MRLRESRRHRNLDQTQLAAITGIPATSISHFEAQSRRPSAGNMIKLAEALDISIDYLVGRTNDPMAHKDLGSYLGEGGLDPEDRALVIAVAERIKGAPRQQPT